MRGYPRNRLTDRSGAAPVVTTTTQSRGHTISFEDAGRGPAIVLIPDATMSAADWRDAGYVDLLAPSRRVLSVDPLGNGLSDKPHDPDAYGWPDVATDIVAVLDAACIVRAGPWGYSRGMWLAGAVAAGFPDRVAALILCGGGDLTKDVSAGTPPSPYAEAMSRGDFGLLWDGGGFTFSEDDRRYDEEFNDPRALGAMAAGRGRSGVSIDLGRVTAPTLAFVGGKDEPDTDRATAEALGAEFHVLPDLDHLEEFSRLDLVMPLVFGFLEPLGL
ncbi:MAG TPA: alpha/beta hydrolase [Candidatus Limnocylindrales bacterium]|jgi:pimeloyl-ACP methyl ester carboxylesterase